MFTPDLFFSIPLPILLTGYASVLAVAISKSGFGGALGALSAPLLLLVLPPKMALAVLLPIFLITDVMVVIAWWKYGVMRLVWVMAGFAIIGQLLGWLLFDYIDDNMLAVMIGLVALIVSGRYLYRQFVPVMAASAFSHRLLRRAPVKRAAIWCGLSGFSSFVSLTGGIPAQVFLLPLKLHRTLFVGTMCWYFLIINLAKIPFFLELDMFSAASIHLTILLVPAIPIGVIAGKWLVKHMSDTMFYHVSHAALGVLGLRLLYSYGPYILAG